MLKKVKEVRRNEDEDSITRMNRDVFTLNNTTSSSSSVVNNILNQLHGSFSQLTVLNLRNIRLTSCDVIAPCAGTLTVLDLSNNALTVLPSFWTTFKKLKVLLLCKNNLYSWKEIIKLKECCLLEYLTFYDNPCTKSRCLRSFLVNEMKHLKCLDHYVVTDEERIQGAGKNIV